MLLTNRLIYIVIQHSYPVYVALVALLLAGALLLVLRLRPHRTAPRVPGPDAWVPASFHAYYLAAGALTGTAFQPPILFLISLAMAGVALAIHHASRSTLPAAASGHSR